MNGILKLAVGGLLLSLSIGTSHAAGAAHQHGAAGQVSPSPECDKPGNAPSLLCAKVPTPYIAPNGGLWLAWVEHGHVYVGHRPDPAGEGVQKVTRVTRERRELDANGESRPKVVVGPQGDVYVTFVAKGERKYTGVLYFSRSVDGGESFSEPHSITDENTSSSQRFASLGVNEDGRIHLAWLDKRDLFAAQDTKASYAGSAMYYAYSDDRGRSFSANRKAVDHSCECCRIAMDYDPDRNPVLLWRHVFGENIRDHAIAKVNADGAIGSLDRISEDNWAIDGCPHHGPALSVAASGDRHVAWFTDSETRSGLFYTRQLAGTPEFSTPMAFGNPDQQAAHPQVMTAGHRVFIAWKEFTGMQSEVYLMQSGDSGETWSVPHRVASANDASDHPFLVKDNHWLYLSWSTGAAGWRLLKLTPIGE